MSFSTSLSGLKNAQRELDVIGHNIANAETNGFKSTSIKFEDVYAVSSSSSKLSFGGMGSTVSEITQNFGNGSISQTGSGLDLAITGNGLFQLKSSDGTDTTYTRNGGFSLDVDGYVTNSTGNRLQIFGPGADPATDSPIDAKVPAFGASGAAFAGIDIGRDGKISASFADGTNEVIGTVALAQFPSASGLRQVGQSQWAATGVSGQATFGTPGTGPFGDIMSGALERSNVDLSEQLVNLISAQRYFQANSRAIDVDSQAFRSIYDLRS